MLWLTHSYTFPSVAYDFLALGDVLPGEIAVLRFRIFIQEAIALVLGIAIALNLLVLAGILGQFELALHYDTGKVLPPLR